MFDSGKNNIVIGEDERPNRKDLDAISEKGSEPFKGEKRKRGQSPLRGKRGQSPLSDF